MCAVAIAASMRVLRGGEVDCASRYLREPRRVRRVGEEADAGRGGGGRETRHPISILSSSISIMSSSISILSS